MARGYAQSRSEGRVGLSESGGFSVPAGNGDNTYERALARAKAQTLAEKKILAPMFFPAIPDVRRDSDGWQDMKGSYSLSESVAGRAQLKKIPSAIFKDAQKDLKKQVKAESKAAAEREKDYGPAGFIKLSKPIYWYDEQNVWRRMEVQINASARYVNIDGSYDRGKPQRIETSIYGFKLRVLPK